MRSFVFLTFTLLLCVIVTDSCKHEYEETAFSEEGITLRLRWNPSYTGETAADAEIALKWTISYLGAELPKGSFARTVKWEDDRIMLVNLSQAGFSKKAEVLLLKLVQLLKMSQEYTVNKSIDLGRFISLTIGSSHHYYQITDVAPQYSSYRSNFIFDIKRYALTSSTISIKQRMIEAGISNVLSLPAFIAHEGRGSLANGTFNVKEQEVIDVMRNGQVRVAIYKADGGTLDEAADTTVSLGGKPAKCIWCHELYFNPSFSINTTNVPGYYTFQQFQQTVANSMSILNQYRAQLNGDIDFAQLQEHAKMEITYISFMEPSANRLALEWNKSMEEVKTIMAGLPTHIYPEFPFLGQLYYRSDADARSAYTTVKVPDSIREKSNYEPDLLK